MIPISFPNWDDDDDTTGNADIAELLRKFSISRSNVDARFLTELARLRISWRSASAESRTSLHPFDSKVNALVEDSIIDRDEEEEEEENVIPVVVDGGGDWLSLAMILGFLVTRRFREGVSYDFSTEKKKGGNTRVRNGRLRLIWMSLF